MSFFENMVRDVHSHFLCSAARQFSAFVFSFFLPLMNAGVSVLSHSEKGLGWLLINYVINFQRVGVVIRSLLGEWAVFDVLLVVVP